MRTLHLFAGAGGGLLADLILGHTPVCAVKCAGNGQVPLQAAAAWLLLSAAGHEKRRNDPQRQ
jgi:uncharacterized membrane protein YeiH